MLIKKMPASNVQELRKAEWPSGDGDKKISWYCDWTEK